MPDFAYSPSRHVRLREAGKDEKWLQDLIEADPSILGLGDLTVITREKKQGSGGRLDFLFWDPDEEIRYEVEIMLGRLDESHIIRAIEYWDLERNRYPALEHKAVIVAEDITSRFFNILALMNKAIPIVAIQLNALVVSDTTMTLSFAKLLDVTELAVDDSEGSEVTKDRTYWERRANPSSLQMVDKLVAALPGGMETARLTYNQGHIAMRTGGRNFCWFHPRQSPRLLANVLTGEDGREALVEKLWSEGIDSRLRGDREISVKLTARQADAISDTVRRTLEQAERFSRGEAKREPLNQVSGSAVAPLPAPPPDQ